MPGSMEAVLLLGLQSFWLEAWICRGGPAAGVHKGWPDAGPVLESESMGANLASKSTWAGPDPSSQGSRGWSETGRDLEPVATGTGLVLGWVRSLELWSRTGMRANLEPPRPSRQAYPVVTGA